MNSSAIWEINAPSHALILEGYVIAQGKAKCNLSF